MKKEMEKKEKNPTGVHPPPNDVEMGPELIVIMRRESEVRMTKEKTMKSEVGEDLDQLNEFLTSENISIQPLFGVSEDRLQAKAASLEAETGEEIPDLSVYYRVEAPVERLEELAEKLIKFDTVEAVYVKPPAEPPQILNDMLPSSEEPPATTPDFTNRQLYLDAAPGGIDARYSWTQSGGRGWNVRIIDIEGAWRFSHEDLVQNQGGVVGGTPTSNLGWRNHGTAVVGEFGGDLNTIGITGICSDANVRSISIFGSGSSSSGAIRQAADMLSPGDIILIELHRPGPRFNFAGRDDQRGYIPVEWWPDDFDAIRYASSRGVIVVEAGGNGAENLDDSIYNTRPSGFPTSWTNPFNRANRDSGAIVVGAGSPPPGTHGRNHGPDRSRLDFSNYGAIIDTQGWGREVTTAGYGDLQGGANEDLWYTDTFSGTSSASPIIVGAIGCAQGVLRARGRIPLTPIRARDLLRSTGSVQQDAPGRPATQRIGNRPNLRQMIDSIIPVPNAWVGVQFTGTIPANQTYRWFTYRWPAQWHVVWTVVPTNPRSGGPQIEFKVQTERSEDRYITYWISITNLTPVPVNIEGRYAVLGW